MTVPLLNLEVIGPKVWGHMHAVAQVYPVYPTNQDILEVRRFIELSFLRFTCSKCVKHMSQRIKEVPLDASVMASRKPLVMWLIDRHNEVNARIDKPTEPYTWESVSEAHWGPGWRDGYNAEVQRGHHSGHIVAAAATSSHHWDRVKTPLIILIIIISALWLHRRLHGQHSL